MSDLIIKFGIISGEIVGSKETKKRWNKIIGRRGGRGKHRRRELQREWRHCRSKFLDLAILDPRPHLPFPLEIPREMPSNRVSH